MWLPGVWMLLLRKGWSLDAGLVSSERAASDEIDGQLCEFVVFVEKLLCYYQMFSVCLLLMVQRRAEGPQMFERWRQDGDYGFERPEQVNAVLLSIDPQHTCGLLKNTWLHKITLINTPSDVMQYFCLMAACDVRLIITSTAWILYERAACDARWEPRSTFTVSHTVINTLG